MSKFIAALLSVAALATPARADHFKIDTVHSFVEFRAGHLGLGYVFGRFNDVSGTFDFSDAPDRALSAFDGTVKTASIDTKVKARDEDLRSSNYFDAVKYPAITFKASTIKKDAAGAFIVGGDLTLHGVTKAVSVKLTKRNEGKDPWGGYRLGLSGRLVVKRSEYLMTKDLVAVDDDVVLVLSFEGTRT